MVQIDIRQVLMVHFSIGKILAYINKISLIALYLYIKINTCIQCQWGINQLA